MSDDDYRRYMESVGEDVVRHRLANRMPIGDRPENNPRPEFATAWLAEKDKTRTWKDNVRFWTLLGVAVISAIAAVIAAWPVVVMWIR
jgi:hypothetical protein